jgi:phosphatidate phosphatase PAH1
MDIDGTITKEDVGGYVTSVFMGMYTYVHAGVVRFLDELTRKHNLHVLYVTSRPMTHMKV